jgi:hypothetical protein
VSALCGRCNKPFVSRHKIATVYGSVTTLSRRCPDCSPETGPRRDRELDCHQYIHSRRVGARLCDGFELRGEDAA